MKHYWLLISLPLSLLVLALVLTTMLNGVCQRTGRGGDFSSQIIQGTYLVSSVGYYQASLSRDLFRIVACENRNWNPYARNPNSSAAGFCQILNGTWQYLEEKWDMELDREDPNDQLYACARLLNEEGWKHWEAIRECLEKLDN